MHAHTYTRPCKHTHTSTKIQSQIHMQITTVMFDFSPSDCQRCGLSGYSSRLRTVGRGLYCHVLFFPSGCQKVGCQTTAPGREICDRDHTVIFSLSKVAVRKRPAVRLQLQAKNFVMGAIPSYSVFPQVTVRKRSAIRLQLQAENFVMGAIPSYSVFPKWLSERGQLLDYSSRLRTLSVMGAIPSYSVFPKWLSERGQLLDYSSRLRTLFVMGAVQSYSVFPKWLSERQAVRLLLQAESFVCDGNYIKRSPWPAKQQLTRSWLWSTAPCRELRRWTELYGDHLDQGTFCLQHNQQCLRNGPHRSQKGSDLP